jgi:hypothetical protein
MDDDGVWVGLRRCGCCAAVVSIEKDYPKDTEKSKREFLKSGLSVVYASGQEWRDKYLPTLKAECPHMAAAKAKPVDVELPL